MIPPKVFELVIATLALALVGAAPSGSAKNAPASSPNTPSVEPSVSCNVTPPDAPITPALLSSGLPCKAIIKPPKNVPLVDGIQEGFDHYSWLTFLALNSPGDGNTVIGKGNGPGGDAPTIWEDWKDIDATMRDGGVSPTPWG